MFCKEGVPRNFAKFKGKLLYQSLFSNKVAAATLLKKKLAPVFSREFSDISKNTFFTEYLWTTTSENYA